MALTIIDPASSWFEIVELPLVRWLKTNMVNGKESSIIEAMFKKSSVCIAQLVNPWCLYLIYNNGSEFKLNFKYLCDLYGIKGKPTTIKNPQANAILEHVHQVLVQMLCTAELNMAESVILDDADIFLDIAAWAICSTYHTDIKASPGTAIFGCNMLFDIPFVANWNEIGDYRQHQTNLNGAHKNRMRINYDYKIDKKVLVKHDGILHKAESPYG